ncbi:MAG: TIGR00282 family metallophosphoesterase [Patescibacteria group bacterium]|nr:TIGR00282 family metallophosphoesterase [Patescibacteria group bacterium]
MKILVFGDLMGRPGRAAVKAALPRLKEKYAPDLVIANGENLAHGRGVTPDTVKEMVAAGIDLFTSGNHVWDRSESWDVFSDPNLRERVLRPANYPPGLPGDGAKLLTIGAKNVLVVNLLGRALLRVTPDDPFRAFDRLINEFASKRPDVVLVDFHAETTSEKVAFGWHAAGRASAVWGTHTHVATADARILPGGTAYATDIGFCGLRDGVIGVNREPILQHFLTGLPIREEFAETGQVEAWGVIIELGVDGRAVSIQTLHETAEIG